MSNEGDAPSERWLTPQELADLQREVDEMPPQEQVGPLPPLESDDPEWVAARWREFAAGGGPRTGRRTRWSARALRRTLAEYALADVVCSGDVIARVYDEGGNPSVLTEVRVLRGGHLSLTFFALVEHPVVAVACRCGSEHRLSTMKLAAVSRGRTPGKPHRVGVSVVVAP